jgi:predicted class III extradiol MEMO1 family dioxygenase
VKSLPDKEKGGLELKFLKYAQSNQCFNNSDSSVSYAAASLISK